MGGRGGSSGMASDGAGYAQQLAQNKNSKDLSGLRRDLMYDLRYYKENGEVRDSDLHYTIIYKNGEMKFFGPEDSDADIRSIKNTNIAYIMLQSGDGIDDSLGFHTFSDLKADRIASNPGEFENYQAEIERMFGTDWGKRHPRR